MEPSGEAPVTIAVMVLCAGVWLYLWSKRVEFESVAFSYRKVVVDGEWWRMVTSSLSHLEIVHLGFNLYSLWNCRVVEALNGSLYYFQTTLVLMALSMALLTLMYHVSIFYVGLPQYEYAFSLGYSCVVFGWMTVLAQLSPQFEFPLLGNASFPVSFAPLGSLLLTQMLVRRASFLGHLAGILAGYLVAFGLFDWLTAYWFYTTLTLVLFALVCNALVTLRPQPRSQDLADGFAEEGALSTAAAMALFVLAAGTGAREPPPDNEDEWV